FIYLQQHVEPRTLHSFPTRRSSDLAERTEEEVTKKFGIGPGDIRRMTDQGEWLLYSMAELGRIFNKKKVRALTRLTTQVQYGVKDRKSTRLNSSHVSISYAVFCLKK